MKRFFLGILLSINLGTYASQNGWILSNEFKYNKPIIKTEFSKDKPLFSVAQNHEISVENYETEAINVVDTRKEYVLSSSWHRGGLLVWNSKKLLAVHDQENNEQSFVVFQDHSSNSLDRVSSSNGSNLVAVSTMQGKVKIYDLRSESATFDLLHRECPGGNLQHLIYFIENVQVVI